MKTLGIVGIFLVINSVVYGNDLSISPGWTYVDDSRNIGPLNWKKISPICDADQFDQSPINIIPDDAQFGFDLNPISLVNGEAYNITLGVQHNTRFLYLVLFGTEGLSPALKIEENEYNFHQGILLYHGMNANDGTLHEINGEKYAAEAMYLGTGNNGLILFFVMFELSEEDNADLQKIIDLIPDVNEIGLDQRYKETEANISSVKGLFPSNMDYYSYNGGLVVPYCNIIQSIVFKNTVPISSAQLEVLRTMKFETADGPVFQSGRMRPVQPLNGRQVFTSVQTFPAFDSFWNFVDQKPYKAEILSTFIIPKFELPTPSFRK